MSENNGNPRVVVIGTGTAGTAAARAARDAGAEVTAVRGGAIQGTTCASVGCMPSKALLAAAARARGTTDGAFGVLDARIDSPTALARADHLRRRFATAAPARMEDMHVLAGDARFDADGLWVADERVAYDALVVATGAQPRIPEAYANVEPLYTYRTVWEADLPERIGIVGGGAIGVELGSALAALGHTVTLFEGSERLRVPVEDRLADLLVERLRAAGVRCVFGEEPDVDPGPPIVLHTADHRAEVDAVLLGVGSEPVLPEGMLDALGLDADALDTVDPSNLQLGDGPVFVAGDLVPPPILHQATREGEAAGRNAARWPDVQTVDRGTPLQIVFSSPQVARAGKPDEAVVFAHFDFRDQGRSVLDGHADGAMRLGADADGRLVSAEIVHEDAEHVAHLLCWVMHTPVTSLLDRPVYHPTVLEGVMTALERLQAAWARREP
jgi:dihydrolipoamide dehydrogenase